MARPCFRGLSSALAVLFLQIGSMQAGGIVDDYFDPGYRDYRVEPFDLQQLVVPAVSAIGKAVE